MKFIRQIVLRWSRTLRRRQRQFDVEVLFPAIWERCGRDLFSFSKAMDLHTQIDPAWHCLEEWFGTDQSPDTWALKRKALDQMETTK